MIDKEKSVEKKPRLMNMSVKTRLRTLADVVRFQTLDALAEHVKTAWKDRTPPSGLLGSGEGLQEQFAQLTFVTPAMQVYWLEPVALDIHVQGHGFDRQGRGISDLDYRALSPDLPKPTRTDYPAGRVGSRIFNSRTKEHAHEQAQIDARRLRDRIVSSGGQSVSGP